MVWQLFTQLWHVKQVLLSMQAEISRIKSVNHKNYAAGIVITCCHPYQCCFDWFTVRDQWCCHRIMLRLFSSQLVALLSAFFVHYATATQTQSKVTSVIKLSTRTSRCLNCFIISWLAERQLGSTHWDINAVLVFQSCKRQKYIYTWQILYICA